jgi:hypothetical protein
MNRLIKIKKSKCNQHKICDIYDYGSVVSIVTVGSYAFIKGFNAGKTITESIPIACISSIIFGGAISTTSVIWPLTTPIALCVIYNME